MIGFQYNTSLYPMVDKTYIVLYLWCHGGVVGPNPSAHNFKE